MNDYCTLPDYVLDLARANPPALQLSEPDHEQKYIENTIAIVYKLGSPFKMQAQVIIQVGAIIFGIFRKVIGWRYLAVYDSESARFTVCDFATFTGIVRVAREEPVEVYHSSSYKKENWIGQPIMFACRDDLVFLRRFVQKEHESSLLYATWEKMPDGIYGWVID